MKKAVRIELTPEQKKQIQTATGKEVPALKLSLVPLEERVSPKIALN